MRIRYPPVSFSTQVPSMEQQLSPRLPPRVTWKTHLIRSKAPGQGLGCSYPSQVVAMYGRGHDQLRNLQGPVHNKNAGLPISITKNFQGNECRALSQGPMPLQGCGLTTPAQAEVENHGVCRPFQPLPSHGAFCPQRRESGLSG